jgi:hypothetical protein
LKIAFFGNLLLKNKDQKTTSSLPNERTCSKCKELKPLNSEHFQVVKSFKSGFSYYCNECNKPKPRD